MGSSVRVCLVGALFSVDESEYNAAETAARRGLGQRRHLVGSFQVEAFPTSQKPTAGGDVDGAIADSYTHEWTLYLPLFCLYRVLCFSLVNNLMDL